MAGNAEMIIERDRQRMTAMAQKDIAARVGASREMINRILRDLTTGGYVSVNDGRITINKAPPARW